jgi:hypothetical protein
MSDHAKIDDVFSIPEKDDTMEDPPAGEFFTRTIDVVATPVVDKANGSRQRRDDPAETPIEHAPWGIGQDFHEEVTNRQTAHQSPDNQRISEPTQPDQPPQDYPVVDLTDIRALLADPIPSNEHAVQTTERSAYLKLVSEKAAIEFSLLQNPEYRTRNLGLIQRLNAAISLLEEIISSGITLDHATAEIVDLDQQILERIYSQVSRQRATAEQTHEPLDNQTRSTQNLSPLTLCIGEDLRLKLLRASVLRDINSFV